MSVTIKTDTAVFERVQLENLKNAGRAMADRILSDATMKAPKLSGALRSDGRVEDKGFEFKVVFGDDRVPYARRRHFENKLHPETKNYLQNAANDIITKGGLKQFL